jgi:gluconolactonase
METNKMIQTQEQFMFKTILFLLLIPSYLMADTQLDGFAMPESVVQDKEGNVFVSEIGERDVDQDGKITKIDADGNRTTLAEGLYDPKGIALHNNKLFVTDRDVVVEVNIDDGSWGVYAGTMQFPKSPVFLNDIEVAPNGDLYVSDSGDFKESGLIFKIQVSGEIEVVFEDQVNFIKAPNGLLIDEAGGLLILDWGGELLQADFKTNKIIKIADGFNGGDGIAQDGNVIYVSSWLEGKVYSVTNGKTKLIKDNFEAAADIALTDDKRILLVPDMKAGTLTYLKVN